MMYLHYIAHPFPQQWKNRPGLKPKRSKSDYEGILFLDASQIHAHDEIPLQERIDEKDRYSSYDRDRSPYGLRCHHRFTLIGIGTVYERRIAVVVHRRAQKLHHLILQRAELQAGGSVQECIEPGVPGADGKEQPDGSEYRRTEREDDPQEDLEVAGAIHLRGFHEAIR